MTASGEPGAGSAIRNDPEALADLARSALAQGEEPSALPAVERAAEQLRDARLWQWAGLLHRSLDEHQDALACFAAAASLAPADASIAHGHARVALEAGIPAVELFEKALQIAAGDPDVLLGLAAAKFASGAGEEAERQLDAAVAASPMWVQGHVQLAQLRSMLGRRADATLSVERALENQPLAEQLWSALFGLAIKANDFDALARAVSRARQAGIRDSLTIAFEAIAAAEKAETDKADSLFAQLPAAPADPLAVWRVRHLLRSGRADKALPVVDAGLAGPGAAGLWPYASVAWRIIGDERSEWLEGDRRMVSAVDLPFEGAELEQLAAHLRSLHVAKGEYLDQSVRGGTQTDGPLLSRVAPEVRSLRSKIVSAIQAHVAQLPAPDPRHPLLGKRRDRLIRFSGSWSVRLRAQGRHANHVHSQGWISSAFYVSLPTDVTSGTRNGWLTLGSPPEELGLDLPPTREIEPVEGRLVLFPSWMWHGTNRFETGERMTVAFDVRPPM